MWGQLLFLACVGFMVYGAWHLYQHMEDEWKKLDDLWGRPNRRDDDGED